MAAAGGMEVAGVAAAGVVAGAAVAGAGRMGLGPGIRRGLRSRVCLGCRTRLGLGSGLGQSLLECGRTLRLGACSRLAIRASGGAFRLALLVILA